MRVSDPSTVPPPPDAQTRALALDVRRSFLVRAPAGSGKTDLLIRRFLALLDTVEHPEEVIAITFTVKAAGEMRDRVLAALALEPARDRWQLLEFPGRLRIQTIDALCQSLMRQMPVLSGFGAPPAVTENAQPHYLAAARATLELLESGSAVADAVARVLAHLDNNTGRLEELLAAMLARRDQWLRRTGALPPRAELESVLAAERERRIAAVALSYGERVDDWDALPGQLLTQKNTWFARLKGAYDGREDLRQALIALRGAPPARYSDVQWEALAAIAVLLPLAAAQLKLVFQAHGEVDFTEVSEAALRALGDENAPTDLGLALDYRLRHLLVDEFQDTSITQYQLIARLTAGWEHGDGRTLFAVGDPMQSIYRFREAEVGEFLKTWQTGRMGNVELERLALEANFRSQSGVIEWVNRSFRRILPTEEDIGVGAVPYSDSVAVHPALEGAAVSVRAWGKEAAAAEEAACLVALIRAARAGHPEGSIAVLVRDRGALREVVPALREAGIRFRAIDIDPLGERAVVRDLWALTRALAHPADRIAWLAVLRAPWCGLTLAEMSLLLEAVPGSEAQGAAPRTVWEAIGDPGRLARLPAPARSRAEALRTVLAPVIGARLRRPLRDTVEAAWLALGGPACVEDDTGPGDAAIYLDALEAEEAAAQLPDPAPLEARLAKLWARPDVHAGDGDVQIMTIHKAKGLEFDTVIVPGLGRRPPNDDKRLFMWLERPSAEGEGTERLLAPIEEAGERGDPIYRWLKDIESMRGANEAARLLYVAATRARRRLHLLGMLGSNGLPVAGSLFHRLWPAIEGEVAIAEPDEAGRQAAAGAKPAFVAPSLLRLASGWRTPPPPPGVPVPAGPAAAEAGAIEYSWVGETARHVGSVVHRWLQRIAESGLDGWDAARLARLDAAIRTQLSGLGVPQAALERAAADVREALARTLADARGRWLLGAHEWAASEYRLRVLQDGVARTCVIDRRFADAQGRRWIVDFKTSRHEGAGLDAFLDREQERYRGQLETYARALAAAGHGRHRLGLYFPLLGAWREWQAED
jgi:ATP-dependent helicase/nuclease subunit A